MSDVDDEVERWAGKVLLALAIAAIAGALALAALGCGSSPPPLARRPDIVVERRACLSEAPPEPRPGVIWEACTDPAWAACLSRESALAVLAYLRDLRRYADDAWTTCGPLEAKENGP